MAAITAAAAAASPSAAALPSSATAASPLAPSACHSLTIALLSDDASEPRRTIDLPPGQACTIGRASKSSAKNMRATPTNALFDCPVVSRTHAELRASPWQPPGRQVTITDKSSLHGTAVNDVKLRPGQPFTLKTGDVIKLGDTVSRGKDTHNGVKLTFRRVDDAPTPPSSTPRAPPTPRGFHLPIESDPSDLDSDGESVCSDPRGHSSAQTTPEQSKMKPGPQMQPIHLEGSSFAQRRATDLGNDDDGAVLAQAQLPLTPAIAPTIPDSVDRDAPELSPEPIDTPAASTNGPVDLDKPDHPSDDEQSVARENTGLSRVLNQWASFSDGDEEHQEYRLDPDFKYGLFDETYLSEADHEPRRDAADDMSGDDTSGESEVGDDAWPPREPSPELGTLDERVQEPVKSPAAEGATTIFSSFASKSKADTAVAKPPYDPVRGSQPPQDGPSTAVFDANASAQKQTSRYTSRWDVRPVVNVSPPVGSSTFGFIAPPLAKDPSGLPGFPSATFYGPPTPSPAFSPPNAGAPFDVYAAPDQYSYPTYMPPAPAARNDGYTMKDKISIENLVTEPLQAEKAAAQQTTMNDFFLPQPDQEAQVVESTKAPSTGSKRKADQMKADQVVESSNASQQTSDTTRATPRHTKKQKRSALRGVAVEAAKVVGYAGMGAAGLAAFLMSPYAQQAIDWLG